MSEAWNPAVETTEAEDRILRLCRKQKVWGFLREHRHLILDAEVRAALSKMYSASGKGRPVSPERLALAMLLQVAFQVPDHEVPTLTAVDRRWRMILDCLDDDVDETLFSQGTVFHFRERAREHSFMTLLLEKTIALARETKGFGHKRLRAMIDSSPLVGAGRVEDTFNLIGRALRTLVSVAASEAGRNEHELAAELALTVVSAKSVKAALDVDWRLPEARNEALNALLDQFSRLSTWLDSQFSAEEIARPPLSEAVALVEKFVGQDTEPDPDSPSPTRRRIKSGNSNRQISIGDPEQRHGRKSKTKLFVGYKRHISVDADVPGLVLSVHVMPANIREHEASAPLLEDIEAQGFEIKELHFDRGYLPADEIHARRRRGMRAVSKPPAARAAPGRFGKTDFGIEVDAGTVTCPSGRVADVRHTPSGTRATFPRATCRTCPLAAKCLPKTGPRQITLHPNEDLFQQMKRELTTAEGRAARRERVSVEHALARLGALQGTKARYRGLQKNQFHAQACAVVANCHVLDGLLARAA